MILIMFIFSLKLYMKIMEEIKKCVFELLFFEHRFLNYYLELAFTTYGDSS